jgi:hypothetical protein
MNKVLVGAALGLAVAVWSQPGLAKTSHKHYRSAPERVASQDGRQNDKEETCGDPYWDCCLSYYRGWGPGACGR